jgi:hypothetical protein
VRGKFLIQFQGQWTPEISKTAKIPRPHHSEPTPLTISKNRKRQQRTVASSVSLFPRPLFGCVGFVWLCSPTMTSLFDSHPGLAVTLLAIMSLSPTRRPSGQCHHWNGSLCYCKLYTAIQMKDVTRTVSLWNAAGRSALTPPCPRGPVRFSAIQFSSV